MRWGIVLRVAVLALEPEKTLLLDREECERLARDKAVSVTTI